MANAMDVVTKCLKIGGSAVALRVLIDTIQAAIRRSRGKREGESKKEGESKREGESSVIHGIRLMARDSLCFGGFAVSFCVVSKIVSVLCERWRGKEDQWNRSIGSFIAAMSILIERQDWVRVFLAQFLLVRALEAVYTSHKINGKWMSVFGQMSHSHTALFLFICGQAMYSYVMRPTAIPASYYQFIRSSGPVAEEALQATRDAERNVPLNVESLHKWYWSRCPEECRGKEVLCSPLPDLVPCLLYHPQTASCFQGCLDAFVGCARKTALMYFIVTTLPLFLRTGVKRVTENPKAFLRTAAMSSARHILFLSSFVGIFQSCVCLFDWAYTNGYIGTKHRYHFTAPVKRCVCVCLSVG
jgi:hypothetical protein